MKNETFGEMIRRRRLAAGLSQEWLATHAGTDRSHLSKIERGTIGTPSQPLLTDLVTAIEGAERDRGIPVEPLSFGATVHATVGTLHVGVTHHTVSVSEPEEVDPLSPEDRAILDRIPMSGARTLTHEGQRRLVDYFKLLQQVYGTPPAEEES